MPLSIRGLSVPALALTLVPGCGEAEPRYTLQQVMYEIDVAKQRLEESLVLPRGLETAREQTALIERWNTDPAFSAYPQSSRFLGDPPRFETLRGEFDRLLAELAGALDGGDLAAARSTYPRLLGACTACHDVYRPGL